MVEFTCSPHTLEQNKTINGKVIESGESVENGGYFYPVIANSKCYVTPIDGNIEIIIPLITFVQNDTLVNKIKFI